ncbi:FixH family protein [Pontibacter ramchanderi]|uniref:YtkA-like protein n=1 Tax=Pontibacter ramchanderi TaxID=1179743 RepID=A0A2N3U9I0_9BACT|nr:FixH family protein [Pontibacter ramchanderi]PKV63418.1 YtkA-like protein [Pontibacter ramchanderi]
MKKYTWLTLWALFLTTLLFTTSCDSDDVAPMPTVEYKKLAEGNAAGSDIKVELYSTEDLATGYNQLYVALFDAAGKRIEQGSVSLKPQMDMGMMKHAAPVENPVSEQTKNGYFPGAVVFTMPSGEMGSWTLGIQVQANGQTGTFTTPVTIKEPATSRLKSFVSKTDGAKYFVVYLQPQKPKVGVNDIEIAVYKANSMMDYPAVTNLSLVLEPEMPTMGHGSPNNVNPTHAGGGHYKGKANFTMTGLWYLHLTINDATGEAGKLHFEVNF